MIRADIARYAPEAECIGVCELRNLMWKREEGEDVSQVPLTNRLKRLNNEEE